MIEGWFFIAAALLAVSGIYKISEPEPTRGPLKAAKLPSGRWAVRLLGIIEVSVGITALVGGSSLAAVGVVLLYAGFSGFVAWALFRNVPLRSCGCFGTADTPPSGLHLAVNLLAVSAALWMAFQGGPGVMSVTASLTWNLLYLVFVGLGTFALALMLRELPALMALVKART